MKIKLSASKDDVVFSRLSTSYCLSIQTDKGTKTKGVTKICGLEITS
jgi:hypothetical protein